MVDMGCGLAYLSFVAHRHFSRRFPRVETVGVEGRLALVEQTRAVARSLGGDFDGLSFVNSSIMGYIHQVLGGNVCVFNVCMHACMNLCMYWKLLYGHWKLPNLLLCMYNMYVLVYNCI